MSEDREWIYVVVSPTGAVFDSQVYAKDMDDALERCVSEKNPKIKAARVEQMKKDGWQVYSRLKWDYMQMKEEPNA